MPEATPITPAETATADPKRRYLCRHVFAEGHRCGSPALRGQSLCYNHSRSRREAPISGRSGTFPMPRIDDRAAIQLALFEVLSRLSGGDIDYKRGGILLYGLQIASSNLPRHATQAAEQQPQVDEVTHDIHLGDLAPIAEFPNPEPAPQSEPPLESVILSEGRSPQSKDPDTLTPAPTAHTILPTQPQHPVAPSSTPVIPSITPVILSEAKNPRIQPGAPQNDVVSPPAKQLPATEPSTPHSAPEMWDSAPKSVGRPKGSILTLPPLQPLTLVAVHATASHQPATVTLQRSHRQNQPRFPRPLARFATPYNSE